MIDWLSAYAGNIADIMFWPMMASTFVLAALIITSFDNRGRHEYMSAEYGAATWRIHAGTQGIAVMWLLFILFSAVPEPNYLVKTKTVEVEKEVNVAVEYDEAFDMCMSNQYESSMSGTRKVSKCEKQALMLANPDLKVVESVRTIYKRDTYRTLYDNCMNGSKDNAKVALCHRAAIQATKQASQIRSNSK